jgi:hypothetical protein
VCECASIRAGCGDANEGPVNPWSIVIKAIVVSLLLELGIRQLRPAKPPFFLGVGAVAMLMDFSTLVLYLTAVHVIRRSTDESATKLAAGAMLFAITVLPFWLSVLAVSLVAIALTCSLPR